MTKISDYTNELTAEPADDDLFDVSVEISPGVFQSNKMKYSEIKAGGMTISNNVIPKGTGSGIEDSTASTSDLGDPDDMYIAHKNNLTAAAAILFQGATGNSRLNANTGKFLTLSIGGNQSILMSALGTQIAAIAGQIATIGLSVGGGIPSTKFEIRGLGNDNTTSGFIITNLTGGAGNISFEVLDDNSIKLKNGTNINEFSTDGTFASNSDLKVPTEKASNTRIDAAIAGLAPKFPTRLATITYLDNVGVGTWTKSGSGVGKTLTAGANGILAIDGINTVLGDRIWIKDEDGSSTNLTDVDQGIYEVTTEGTGGVAAILTRATDFDGDPAGEVKSGSYAFVKTGTDNTNTGWIVSSAITITVDTDPIPVVQFHAFSAITVFADNAFRIQDNGDASKELAFEVSAIATSTVRTVTMPDANVDLGNLDQDVTIGSSPVLSGSNFTNVTKIIFSDYIIGTTDGPTTTVTTEGTAVVIAEMTKTFTPASATNKIEVSFGSSFNNSGDQAAIVGIFIDGNLEAETETREYANAGVFPGSIHIFWQGTHATSPMTITVRMWTTGGTLTATGVLRNMLVKEIRE